MKTYVSKLAFASLSDAGLIHTSTTQTLFFYFTIHNLSVSASLSVCRTPVDTYLFCEFLPLSSWDAGCTRKQIENWPGPACAISFLTQPQEDFEVARHCFGPLCTGLQTLRLRFGPCERGL